MNGSADISTAIPPPFPEMSDLQNDCEEPPQKKQCIEGIVSNLLHNLLINLRNNLDTFPLCPLALNIF